jgi:hypothetical protein
MTQGLIRRIATAGALVATLTLAAPAHAAGWPHGASPATDLFQAAWQWAVSLWTPQASVAHHVSRPSGSNHGSIPGMKSDLGAAADPNGRPSTFTGSCQTNCFDPNG